LKTFVGFLILLLILGCNDQDKDSITIAAAANMQFAIEKIAQVFSEQTGIHTELVIASSGKLTAQIKEGAPYDIFVSANTKYPKEIYDNTLAIAPPKVYAQGQLVLWSVHDHIQLSLSGLTDPSIQHIAIANPKTAPYGEATMRVLRDIDLYEAVKHKLVYGESIAQTNQFIISQSAEVGFTAKSVVMSSHMKSKGQWIGLDRKGYQLIEQSVVVIKKENKDITNAQRFYAFLFSEEAKEILEDFGYLVPR